MILQVIALAVVLVAVQVQTVQDKKKRKALSVSERLKSKHRQSAFDQSWIKEYKWLESVKEKDKISGMKINAHSAKSTESHLEMVRGVG